MQYLINKNSRCKNTLIFLKKFFNKSIDKYVYNGII